MYLQNVHCELKSLETSDKEAVYEQLSGGPRVKVFWAPFSNTRLLQSRHAEPPTAPGRIFCASVKCLGSHYYNRTEPSEGNA